MAINISGSTIIDDSRNIVNAGIITATAFSGDGSGLTGVASTDNIITSTASTFANINSTGIVTATAFSGDGSGLTGVGVGTEDSINTSGIITASTISANEFIGTGDKLIFSPSITSFSPTDGSTGVNALSSPDISVTYNQPVNIGTGVTITLRKDSASGTIVESYEVGVSTRATLSNQTLTIDPTDNFDYDQEYYVVIPQGTVTNYVDGNNALLDTYNFTTEAGPVVTSVTPDFGATDVGISTNITFTYDKTIRAGVGTITLRTVSAAGTITESYDVTSSGRLTFSTNTLTIDPTSDLDINTNYYVVVPNNAVAGYAGTDTYEFTTLNFVLNSIDPSNGATNVAVDTNITLTFNSPPTKGTGTVELRSGSVGGSLIESFDAASSGQITVSGNDWILNPSSNLSYEDTVYTIIPSTAIVSYEGLNIGGGTDSHSFTVEAPALGDSYEGGYLICKASTVRWIVAPAATEVSETWYSRNSAVTAAEASAACGDWFVPTCGQLQNPGYACRTYWDSYSPAGYWSSTSQTSTNAWRVFFDSGGVAANDKSSPNCVRAFRCVSY